MHPVKNKIAHKRSSNALLTLFISNITKASIAISENVKIFKKSHNEMTYIPATKDKARHIKGLLANNKIIPFFEIRIRRM